MTFLAGELIKLMTVDGNTLMMSDEIIQALAYTGFGAPPTDYQTRRGYKQHGATELDFTLGIRNVTLHLHRVPGCDRQAYWDNRLALHQFLRPNRGGALTLTLRTQGDEYRSLVVRAEPGLDPAPLMQGNNNWDIDEVLEFVAFDPIWFDPEEVLFSNSSTTDTDLVFPITFPIVFGLSGVFFSTGSFTYAGTWKSYPTITLTGPYTRATITNTATGISIIMNVAIAAGEQRIISLTPGDQSIVDALGNNKFSDLSPGSNLIDFNIRPDPEVPGGIQSIDAGFVDGTSDSAFELSFYTRYFAL